MAMPNPEKGDKRLTQAAVALAYETNDRAPRVVARGEGLLAERIIALAKAHDVYVHESKALMGLLMQVELDQHIPPQLYQAIAEILAWLYQMEQGHVISAPDVMQTKDEPQRR